MRPGRFRVPDAKVWEESFLAMDTETLLQLARNYIGAIKSPWDKRSVVARLTAFARKPETVQAMLALFDELDMAIACTLILAGPLTDAELRSLFHGEVKAFDLDGRVANLEDRLVLFRLRDARVMRHALNPLLRESLARHARNPHMVFNAGAVPAPASVGEERSVAPRAAERLSPLFAALALFSFVLHSPGAVKKGGMLSKKAAARLGSVIPEADSDPERYAALIQAFEETGILARNGVEGDYDADSGAFGALLERHGAGLPFRLALALALPRGGTPGTIEALAAMVGSALDALPRDLPLPETGLARWLGIATLDAETSLDMDALVKALSALRLIERRGGGFFLEPEASSALSEERAGSPQAAFPQLVADGSHLLRVLPEAGQEARWLAARIARPARLGLVWELELDRESTREAFAAGLEAKAIVEALAKFSVRPIPQSLAFSMESWEKEFRSTRLFHGWVLVCDERRRTIVEGRPDIAALVKERLGPGVYLLDAAEMEDFAPIFAAAGIEVPPPIRPHAHLRQTPAFPEMKGRPSLDEGGRGVTAEAAQREEAKAFSAFDRIEARDSEAADNRQDRVDLDPEPALARLRAALASRMASARSVPPADSPGGENVSPAEAAARERSNDRERSSARTGEMERELADRIESRLIVDEAQLARADVTLVRVEAGGLDYGGKTRLAERAIASPGDRLEIKYQLSGGEPESVTMRPVRLQKTDRGLVLEGEDLAAGTPVRVPLGAASMVRRLRATPFGDER